MFLICMGWYKIITVHGFQASYQSRQYDRTKLKAFDLTNCLSHHRVLEVEGLHNLLTSQITDKIKLQSEVASFILSE